MSDDKDDKATTEPAANGEHADRAPGSDAAASAPDAASVEAVTEESKPNRRRIRRSAQIELPDEPAAAEPADSSSEEGVEEPHRKRRRRRKRRSKTGRGDSASPTAAPEGESAVATTGEASAAVQPTRTPKARRRVKPPVDPVSEGAAATPARPTARRSRSTMDRRADGRRGARRPRGEHTGEPRRRDASTPQRKAADAPAGARKPAGKAEEPKASQKPGKGEDMITLILHPQPKAAPVRRKRAGRPMTAKEALRAKAAKRGTATRPKAKGDDSPGDVTLLDEWLEADGSNAVAATSAAGEAATRLIGAWQDRSNAAAVAAVAYESAGDESVAIAGPVRKAARRALQVLKSRGVEIPDRLAAEVPAARPSSLGEREAEACVATFVPPDTNGMTFFSISQRLPGGRYRVADVVIRDELGILHASSGKLAGKQIRRWRQRVESRLGTAPVEVPLSWARYRIAEARKQNDVSGQVLPLGLDSCAPLFQPVPDEPPPHPISTLIEELAEAEVAAATADSEQLHGEPEFRSWLPDRPALDEMLRKVGARVGAEGANDRDLVDKVLAEEIEAAADRYFTPEVRAAVARRMQDAAISIGERLDEEATRRVLSVAKAVQEAGLITSPPREVPFLVGFFRKSMALLAQQGDGRLQVPLPATPPDEPDSSAAPEAEAEASAESGSPGG